MTPLGTYLRRERKERGLLLGEHATQLNISAPYLSQLETGQRPIPDGFDDKIIKQWSLQEIEANELRRAVALSRSAFSISMDGDADEDDRLLAHDLADNFARLTPEAKAAMRKLLPGGRHG